MMFIYIEADGILNEYICYSLRPNCLLPILFSVYVPFFFAFHDLSYVNCDQYVFLNHQMNMKRINCHLIIIFLYGFVYINLKIETLS